MTLVMGKDRYITHGYFSDELSLLSVAMKIHVITEINYHCNVIFLYTACVVNGVDC